MDNKQLRKTFNGAVERTLPNIFRTQNNNIRVGIVKTVQLSSSTATVKYLNSGAVVSNIAIPKNISSIFVNDTVVVFTNDTNLSRSAYILAVYGGNRADSGYVPPM